MVWFRVSANVSMGHLSRVANEIFRELEDAFARNDLSLVPMWAGPLAVLVGVARGDVTLAEHNFSRARAAWFSSEVTVQDLCLQEGGWYLHVHAGRFREALQSAVAWHARLKRSAMSRSRWFMSEARLAVGLAAAALAGQTPSAAERRALLRQADRFARADGDYQSLVRAALACQRGDRSGAIAALRETPPPSHGRLHLLAARRRLGVLLGDAEGASLIRECDDYMRAGGAVDPERLAATLLPGMELPELRRRA